MAAASRLTRGEASVPYPLVSTEYGSMARRGPHQPLEPSIQGLTPILRG
jgi:hypothetical protein